MQGYLFLKFTSFISQRLLEFFLNSVNIQNLAQLHKIGIQMSSNFCPLTCGLSNIVGGASYCKCHSPELCMPSIIQKIPLKL